MPRNPRADADLKARRRQEVRAFLKKHGIPEGLASTQERRQVMAKFFGGKCRRCGFEDFRALQIDHVYGDGYKSFGEWRWLLWDIIRNTDRYQCLCANCNWIKRAENGEHPGKRRPRLPTYTRLDERRDWIDTWIEAEGLRPAKERQKAGERKRARRIAAKEIMDRVKQLRAQDRATAKAERQARSRALSIEQAAQQLAKIEARRRKREELEAERRDVRERCADKKYMAEIKGTPLDEIFRAQRYRLGIFARS